MKVDEPFPPFSSADIRIFDPKICQKSYENIFDPQTEICAGDYEQRIDTMVSRVRSIFDDFSFVFIAQTGDSGGPLLIRQADGRWIVLGITSYGSIDHEQHAPGVYVKLSAYEDWLSTHLQS